jgi:hypothetical protein
MLPAMPRVTGSGIRTTVLQHEPERDPLMNSMTPGNTDHEPGDTPSPRRRAARLLRTGVLLAAVAPAAGCQGLPLFPWPRGPICDVFPYYGVTAQVVDQNGTGLARVLVQYVFLDETGALASSWSYTGGDGSVYDEALVVGDAADDCTAAGGRLSPPSTVDFSVYLGVEAHYWSVNVAPEMLTEEDPCHYRVDFGTITVPLDSAVP